MTPISIQREAAPDQRSFLDAIYAGSLFLIPPNHQSTHIVARVRSFLTDELAVPDPRSAQFEMAGDELFERIGRVRRRILDPSFDHALAALLSSLGLDPSEHAFDPLRLRAVTHDGHNVEKARPAYTAHRDTWYANPQSQLNWWLPLFDVSEEQVFRVFPKYFSSALANSSDGFDYDTWIKEVGWQNYSGGKPASPPVYPSPLEPIDDCGWRSGMRAGEVFVFSAAHLHQTAPNTSGQTRFSLDFRTVHLADNQMKRGAPNLDNGSTGSAVVDYRRFAVGVNGEPK